MIEDINYKYEKKGFFGTKDRILQACAITLVAISIIFMVYVATYQLPDMAKEKFEISCQAYMLEHCDKLGSIATYCNMHGMDSKEKINITDLFGD